MTTIIFAPRAPRNKIPTDLDRTALYLGGFRITVLRPPQTSYGHHKNVRKNPYDARMKSVEVGGP